MGCGLGRVARFATSRKLEVVTAEWNAEWYREIASAGAVFSQIADGRNLPIFKG